jgi:bifunctional DNase/RNase
VHLEKVKIKRIIGPTPSGAAVLLGNDKKTFVVFVGFYEAAAILREINHEIPARPLTHELLQNVFLGFDLGVKQIIISEIQENTFCATLILEQKMQNGSGEWVAKRNEVRIDARPSDCFVIALKNSADIFVTREVFDQVQDVSKMTDEVEGSLSGGQLAGVSPGELEFNLGEEGEAENPFLGESLETPSEGEEEEGEEEDEGDEGDEEEEGDEEDDEEEEGKG